MGNKLYYTLPLTLIGRRGREDRGGASGGGEDGTGGGTSEG